MYESLTAFLGSIRSEPSGEWVVDNTSKGTLDDPVQMPWVNWSSSTLALVDTVYEFEEVHPEFGLKRYTEILEANGIEWSSASMENADVSRLDGQCVMALIIGGVRADRFCEGQLKKWIDSGLYAKWLARLKELDEVEGKTA